jgi:hypothetical protein
MQWFLMEIGHVSHFRHILSPDLGPLADNEQPTSKGADDINVEKVTVWFEEAVDVLGEWVGHWKRHRKHHLCGLVEVVGKVCM